MALNILLITADDLNYSSTGIFGCEIEGITPNIDGLAKEGVTFRHAYVTISVCQPSRQALMTGRYPHRNGALGFSPIAQNVPTLQELLRDNGYMNGIISKTDHLAPSGKFCWDYFVECDNEENGWGRDGEKYGLFSREFFEKAKQENKPFFLMANSNDPHRPFAGSAEELETYGKNLIVERTYSSQEIEVPGFLPDIEGVRKEMAEYFTSVHRCDKTIGFILKALEESGLANNTIVMFLSDNGISQPFAKANCYQNSNQTPWIVKWPGVIKPDTWDEEHMIAGVDFMPTILEAAGIAQIDGMDGKSFYSLLKGEKQEGRDWVYTMFNITNARHSYPMRCLRSKKHGYIYNAWADNETSYVNEAAGGMAFASMKEAAGGNKDIAERVRFFTYRTKEEFYDYENDPDGLNNLLGKEEYREKIMRHKKLMLAEMQRSDDPLMGEFKNFCAKG